MKQGVEVDNSLIESEVKSKKGYLIIKRILDIILSLLGIIILSPLLCLIMILIKVDDPKGKVFFKQKRIGRNNQIFICYKFRTMVHNAEQLMNNFTTEQKEEFAKGFKLKNDPRITKVGNILRKTSLDELPQLFNILKGEMSIVGPRPIVKKELELYGEYAKTLVSVKPGLTGLWQVNGRSDITYDQRVQLDMNYIRESNIKLDTIILFKTVSVVIKKTGAR